MARNQEKHGLTMNRWFRYQQFKESSTVDVHKRNKAARRKPNKHPNFGPWQQNPNITRAENGRKLIITEIQQLLAKIYNPVNRDHDVTKINDEINEKMKQKEELEKTISKMGGTNYKIHGTPITEDFEEGPEGKLYFGPARDFLGTQKRQMAKTKVGNSFVGKKSLKNAIMAGLKKGRKRKRLGLANASAAKKQKTEAVLDPIEPEEPAPAENAAQAVNFYSKKPIELDCLEPTEGPARKPASPKKSPASTKGEPKPVDLSHTSEDANAPKPSGEEVFGVKDDFSARQFPELATYRKEEKSTPEKEKAATPAEKAVSERPLPQDFLASKYESQPTTFEEMVKPAEEKAVEKKAMYKSPAKNIPGDDNVPSPEKKVEPEEPEKVQSDEEDGVNALGKLAALFDL